MFLPPSSWESPAHQYLHRLLVASGRLGKLAVSGIEQECGQLQELARSLRVLRNRTAALLTPSGVSGDALALLLEYLRHFFLQEVTTYYFVHNEIIRRMDQIVRLYSLVGEIDALAAVASLRAERPDLAVPEIHMGGLFVTGSNMSGKSTFLRTLGVNQILATTIRIAFARRLLVSPLLTISSITNRDSLLDAESHYIVEAGNAFRLLRLLGYPAEILDGPLAAGGH